MQPEPTCSARFVEEFTPVCIALYEMECITNANFTVRQIQMFFGILSSVIIILVAQGCTTLNRPLFGIVIKLTFCATVAVARFQKTY